MDRGEFLKGFHVSKLRHRAFDAQTKPADTLLFLKLSLN